jgi:transcriptional regulator with XRE-family HTH domain
MSNKSPDQTDIEVGQRIRMMRQTAGISQTELAEGLGVTFQQVQKYELGINRVGAGRLTMIAGVLDVSVGLLFGANEHFGITRTTATQKDSPLSLVTKTGALRLLRAYSVLQDEPMRRAVVGMVENLAKEPAGKQG